LKQLAAFVAVVEDGTVSKAATHLHRAQPVLSTDFEFERNSVSLFSIASAAASGSRQKEKDLLKAVAIVFNRSSEGTSAGR
jgi:hypothetical protein